MNTLSNRLKDAAKNIHLTGMNKHLQESVASAFIEAATEIDGLTKEAVRYTKTNMKQEVEITQFIGEIESLKSQLYKFTKATEALEIDSEECLDFDECTAMLVPLDTYHNMIECLNMEKEFA